MSIILNSACRSVETNKTRAIGLRSRPQDNLTFNLCYGHLNNNKLFLLIFGNPLEKLSMKVVCVLDIFLSLNYKLNFTSNFLVLKSK
jgi:hypothetical protein